MKLYSYYSSGGYKDMYLGELNSEAKASYFLPLLSIQKKLNEIETEQLEFLENLPKIALLSRNNTYGFPEECDKLFTHGGYMLMYRTLQNGSCFLAIRDLMSVNRDEEGRSNTFTYVFLANNPEDICLLDRVALFALQHIQELKEALSPTICYDTQVNGIRCDLDKIWTWINSMPKNETLFDHRPGYYDYIMLTSFDLLSTITKEFQIATDTIRAIVDYRGEVLKGRLRIIEQTNIGMKEMPRSKTKPDKLGTPHMANEPTQENESVKEPIDEQELKLAISQMINILKDIQEKEKNREKLDKELLCIYHPEEIDCFGVKIPCSYVKWIFFGLLILGFVLGLLTGLLF